MISPNIITFKNVCWKMALTTMPSKNISGHYYTQFKEELARKHHLVIGSMSKVRYLWFRDILLLRNTLTKERLGSSGQ